MGRSVNVKLYTRKALGDPLADFANELKEIYYGKEEGRRHHISETIAPEKPSDLFLLSMYNPIRGSGSREDSRVCDSNSRYNSKVWRWKGPREGIAEKV